MAKETEQVKNDISSDPVIAQLQSTITKEADRVSSSTTGIEDSINRAISGVQASGDASAARINSQYGRAVTEGMKQGQRNVDNFSESRSGFATQLPALRNLVGETDNYLKDLASRKEEALLLNDSETAKQIANLEVTGLKMKQDAIQQTFSNLLQVTSMGLQARQFELGQGESKRQFDLTYSLNNEQFQLAKDAQSFQEKSAMADIALEFGLSVGEKDTIETMVTKAASTGQVNEKRALELEALRAQIANSNAQAAKALKGDTVKTLDPLTAEILAKEYRVGKTEFMGGLDSDQQLIVLNQIRDLNVKEETSITKLANSSNSLTEFNSFMEQVLAGKSEAEKARLVNLQAQAAVNTVFKPDLPGELSKTEKDARREKVLDDLIYGAF